MKRALLLLFLLVGAVLAWGYANVRADPIVRQAHIIFPDWPQGAPPIRVALVSDLHVQAPDMPPGRVTRLLDMIQAQRPDLILLAGDYIGDRDLSTRQYSPEEIAALIGRLHAPLGVYAVLGNHDERKHGRPMRRALEAVGVHMLANGVAQVGPLVLGATDYGRSRPMDLATIDRAAAYLRGPHVLLTHSPDAAASISGRFGLVLAGHTHCGQIVLPVIGPVASSSHYGGRFRCGLIREGGRRIVVTAGLGASVLPLRFGAPPDYWVLTLGPR